MPFPKYFFVLFLLKQQQTIKNNILLVFCAISRVFNTNQTSRVTCWFLTLTFKSQQLSSVETMVGLTHQAKYSRAIKMHFQILKGQNTVPRLKT